MKPLSKFCLATLLLTVASASWAACPEGYKSNYKGECVPTQIKREKLWSKVDPFRSNPKFLEAAVPIPVNLGVPEKKPMLTVAGPTWGVSTSFWVKDVDQYDVKRSDIGIVDHNARFSELQKLPQGVAQQTCRVQQVPEPPEPVMMIKTFNQESLDQLGLFAPYVGARIANWMVTGEVVELQNVWGELYKWASRDALKDLIGGSYCIEGPVDGGWYINWDCYEGFNGVLGDLRQQFLIPILAMYPILIDKVNPSTSEVEIVQNWLRDLMWRSEQGLDEGHTYEGKKMFMYAHHHTTPKGLSYLLWGIVDNDVDFFRAGIAHYYALLASTRRDGTLATEVWARESGSGGHGGPTSLEHVNENLGFMVTMAEAVARQGYDLYSVTYKGANIHKMIDAFVTGYNRPEQWKKHTGVDTQDLSLIRWWDDVQWIPAYLRSNPKSPQADALRVMYKKQNQPKYSAFFGGAVYCFFGPL